MRIKGEMKIQDCRHKGRSWLHQPLIMSVNILESGFFSWQYPTSRKDVLPLNVWLGAQLKWQAGSRTGPEVAVKAVAVKKIISINKRAGWIWHNMEEVLYEELLSQQPKIPKRRTSVEVIFKRLYLRLDGYYWTFKFQEKEKGTDWKEFTFQRREKGTA